MGLISARGKTVAMNHTHNSHEKTLLFMHFFKALLFMPGLTQPHEEQKPVLWPLESLFSRQIYTAIFSVRIPFHDGA